MTRTRLTKEQILKIKDLRASGKTTKEIALSLSVEAGRVVTTSAVRYWIDELIRQGLSVPTTVKRGGQPTKLE